MDAVGVLVAPRLRGDRVRLAVSGAQEKVITTSLKRFALVAFGGFIVNEVLLAVLVWSGLLPQIPSLILSTGIAAIVTFFASRNWAFRRLSKDPAPRMHLGR